MTIHHVGALSLSSTCCPKQDLRGRTMLGPFVWGRCNAFHAFPLSCHDPPLWLIAEGHSNFFGPESKVTDSLSFMICLPVSTNFGLLRARYVRPGTHLSSFSASRPLCPPLHPHHRPKLYPWPLLLKLVACLSSSNAPRIPWSESIGSPHL